MRSQFASWRGVMCKILSRSARLYTAVDARSTPRGTLANIIFKYRGFAQLESLWTTVENPVGSHAAGMGEVTPRVSRWPLTTLNRNARRLILLVRTLEVGELVIALEVPDAG